ncbi:DUF6979 family protein [Atlantibacter hermannii]|uniref:DUF6979 family protein n=1 Tax=Atlantibacter hermannii TaxID=565 RepID=UPI0028A0806A|nr:hypothetical protein [Atlantibacter hermannii]
MGNYAKAALKAYGLIINDSRTPLDAWNEAISSVTTSTTSRKKGCPRTTFLALAENGYLKGVCTHTSVQRKGVLYERAIAAANLILSYPLATPHYLSENLGYIDKQGSFDIVIALAKNGLLQRSK